MNNYFTIGNNLLDLFSYIVIIFIQDGDGGRCQFIQFFVAPQLHHRSRSPASILISGKAMGLHLKK